MKNGAWLYSRSSVININSDRIKQYMPTIDHKRGISAFSLLGSTTRIHCRVAIIVARRTPSSHQRYDALEWKIDEPKQERPALAVREPPRDHVLDSSPTIQSSLIPPHKHVHFP